MTNLLEERGVDKQVYSWKDCDYRFRPVARKVVLDEVSHIARNEMGKLLACPCGHTELYAYGQDRLRCSKCGRRTEARMLPLEDFTPAPWGVRRFRFKELTDAEKADMGDFRI